MKQKEIERSVVQKLLARKVMGKNTIRLVTLLRCGWKSHEKGLVKKAVKNLLKKGLLKWVKKSKKSLTLNK